MPLMSVRDYSEPEQLAAAYVGAKVEITPTGRVPLATHVVRMELNRLWMHRVDESAPRIKWATQSQERSFIRLLARTGADFVIDGTVLRPGEIVHLGHGHAYYDRTNGPVHWVGLSVPTDDLSEAATVITGSPFMTPREPVHIAAPRKAMSRLRRLYANAFALADETPQTELSIEGARSLEQSIIEAMIDCFREPDAKEPTWARQCHATVLRRFRRLLESSPNRALYMPEICAAIGVPERTLRLCCQEHLGMSPKHYLLLRRLHLSRRALRAAEPDETTVTDVATNFGFWHFGRFAGSYRMAFGEPPSATLARPPD
jgi:AraC-like DNA-binding protein